MDRRIFTTANNETPLSMILAPLRAEIAGEMREAGYTHNGQRWIALVHVPQPMAIIRPTMPPPRKTLQIESAIQADAIIAAEAADLDGVPSRIVG